MGSLFDGIGGFPLAASRHGIKTLWASEIEAFPIAVTKLHFPHMLHVGDITKLKGWELPPVDIITGGSPCQELSVASTKRLGLAGERSGLFMEQIRVIKEMREADIQRGRTAEYIRPRFGIWKNVPPCHPEPQKRRTSGSSSKNSSELAAIPYQSLDLTPCAGNLLDEFYWEILSPWRGESSIRNTGPAPHSGAAGSTLSSILEDNPHPKYYLTRKACAGIIRRSSERDKPLPSILQKALELQAGISRSDSSELEGAPDEAVGFDGYNGDLTGGVSATLGTNCGMSTGRNGIMKPIAFAANQRDI